MILFFSLLLIQSDLEQARDVALKGGGSGIIMRGGMRVFAWGDLKKRYDLKSTTKSFGATALGIAIKDGRLKLSDMARDRHPSFGVPPESNKATRVGFTFLEDKRKVRVARRSGEMID